MNSTAINTHPQIHTMIVAAGRGSRFGASVAKQYVQIEGETLLQRSVARLASSAYIDNCLLVLAADDTIAKNLDFAMPVDYALGGDERWQSVRAGVDAIFAAGAADDDLILIHDAARPTVPTSDIERVIEAAKQEHYGAILATPVADTLKQAQISSANQAFNKENLKAIETTNSDYYIASTVDRTNLWQAQTPQVFRAQALRHALAYISEQKLNITDEASAFEQLNLPIRLITGSRQNIKLTYPDDAFLITAIITTQSD